MNVVKILKAAGMVAKPAVQTLLVAAISAGAQAAISAITKPRTRDETG